MNLVKTFLESLPQLFVECYRHRRWVWHGVAALLTVILVLSGFDWWFYQHTRADFLQPLIWLAALGGFFVPVLLAVVLYWVGEWRRNNRLIHLGAAVAQAQILAVVIVSVYKACTGRIQPEFLTHFSSVDISHEFQFGFLRHGIFWGWPSSHAAVAVSAATVLFLSVRSSVVRVVIVTWAAVVCAGAAVGFHWFSDVVAGIIVGVLIGYTVYHYKK